ncbi:MAG: diacylglycerol kinase family lipid kinase [Candidatus Aureabacteria bacterium]|nr:diacylglycerol kinase family lipid kinase [Candidatus Auribacterota bacterium]
MVRARLIVNPDSRHALGARRLSKIEQFLSGNGISVETCHAAKRGEARKFAAEASASGLFQTVICAGGDGTIHEVINGMIGTDLTLGILPTGTGNVLAWELGIPRNPLDASEVIVRGRIREIDLARSSEGGYFSCMAGVGIDAQAVNELNLSMKEMLGAMAYAVSGFRTVLHYILPEISIEIDGVTPPIKGYAVVVCNSRHYGGRFMLCPGALIDDGSLDICILRERTKHSLIWCGMAILLNIPRITHGISFYCGKTVRISSPQPVLVQMDGDVIGVTPIEFSIVPKALKVMVPA